MTLKDFAKIAWRITNDIYMREYWKPDAVCVSRKIFNDLAYDAREMVLFAKQEDTTPDAMICGLKLFIDDDMPDDYYQIGFMEQFLKYFDKKRKHKEEGI